jgi:transposase-like protein
MAISVKGAHFPQEVMLMGVRWDVASPLSTRHGEKLLEERGVELDHATINRGGITESPRLEDAWHRRQRPVWVRWRREETSRKGQGEWT